MTGRRSTGGPDGGIRQAIRAELRRQCVTQIRLAELLGCTEKHVSCLLRGRSGMTVEMLDRIAEVLDARWVLMDYEPALDGEA